MCTTLKQLCLALYITCFETQPHLDYIQMQQEVHHYQLKETESLINKLYLELQSIFEK